MIRSMAAVACTAAALAGNGDAFAEMEGPTNRDDGAPACTGSLVAEAAVKCAVWHSPEIRQARDQLAAIAGRRVAAGVWLPSNPFVAATLARRKSEDAAAAERGTVRNWSVTLSQELELAGQRGARLDVADAEAAAQVRRVAVAEQDVAARAFTAYFEAVAAREALALAEELTETGRALATLAEARAKEALLSGVDADVARAEATRFGLVRYESERRWAVARAALAILVGAAGTVDVVGSLESARDASLEMLSAEGIEANALRVRGEIAAAEMERRVLERELSLLRRERVPNLTLSAFAQRDGFAEQVLGGGVSLPIPLPAPIGRTRAGEIGEAIGRIRVAESSVELARRRVRLEVAEALAAFQARKGALDLFGGDLLPRARRDLAALREGIMSRQLSLRDAVVAQRSLIELLQAGIEARLAYAEARVELRRVAGVPLLPGAGARP
jgi:cobalt-zinc-cadmium efflux system outer membrane protein